MACFTHAQVFHCFDLLGLTFKVPVVIGILYGHEYKISDNQAGTSIDCLPDVWNFPALV